jgi:ribosomal protein S18 acetylase RimI-like enzyme
MTSPDIVFSGMTTKGVPIVIRYPKQEDLLEMWRMINELSQERTFIMYQGEEISLQEEREYLTSQLDKIQKKKSIQLVAFCDGVLAGITSIDFLEKIERHTGVFGVSVLKAFRGQGIGTQLMKEVFSEAVRVRPSLEIMILWVFSNNELAIRMYEHFGFREYGRLPHGVKLEHGYVDRISMYKSLKK